MLQDKESLERHSDNLQKGLQIRRIAQGSFRLSQCKSSGKKTCWLTKSVERHKSWINSVKNMSVKPYSLVSKPEHLLPFQIRNRIKACSPVRSSWTDNEQLHTESPNFGPRVVNTRPWRHYPNMGSYLHPNMVKNANFRGLRRIWEFLPTLRGVIILPPRQPRFLARLPLWQLIIFTFAILQRKILIETYWLQSGENHMIIC